MARVGVCDRCGRKWQVSRILDTSRGYICPDCDVRMGGERLDIYLLPKSKDR